MGLSEKHREIVEDRRRDGRPDGSPLLEEDVKVVGAGRGGDTPYVSPTSRGASIAGIEMGDDVVVEVYQDGVFISPTSE